MYFKTDRPGRTLRGAVAGTGTIGLLAAMAVVGVTAPAYADDVPCGVPARDAIYQTIYYAAQPAVYETVVVSPERTEERLVTPGKGAVTEDVSEWSHSELPPTPEDGWEFTGETRTHVTRAAADGVAEQGYFEFEWLKVIPAVTVDHPAEYKTVVTEREYKKVKTAGHFTYEWMHALAHWVKKWSTDDPGFWWVKTGDKNWIAPTYETKWFPASRNVGDEGWEPTGEVKTKDVLDKAAWTETVTPEQRITEWSVETPGAGFAKTGEKRWVKTADAVDPVAEQSHPDFLFTRTVVLEPGTDPVYETVTIPAVTEQKLVKEAVVARTERVLVSPATPAGPPCEDDTPPAQPADRIETSVAETLDCEEGIFSTTTTTTTTAYVWDVADKVWELGEPMITTDTEERAVEAGECSSDEPVGGGDGVEPIVDEVAGVEQERGPKGDEPGKSPVVKDEVLGVERSAPVAVPTAVNAGLGGAVDQERNTTGEALLGGSALMLLLAGWLRFGRRERGANEA